MKFKCFPSKKPYILRSMSLAKFSYGFQTKALKHFKLKIMRAFPLRVGSGESASKKHITAVWLFFWVVKGKFATLTIENYSFCSVISGIRLPNFDPVEQKSVSIQQRCTTYTHRMLQPRQRLFEFSICKIFLCCLNIPRLLLAQNIIK